MGAPFTTLIDWLKAYSNNNKAVILSKPILQMSLGCDPWRVLCRIARSKWTKLDVNGYLISLSNDHFYFDFYSNEHNAMPSSYQ